MCGGQCDVYRSKECVEVNVMYTEVRNVWSRAGQCGVVIISSWYS